MYDRPALFFVVIDPKVNIASGSPQYFFSGGNADNLTNVQFVYMAVAGLGVLLGKSAQMRDFESLSRLTCSFMAGGLFLLIKLPEVSEAELQAEANALAEGTGSIEDAQLAKPFIKQYRPIFGFICQFM